MTEMVDKHDKEIIVLKTRFDTFEESVNSRFDEIVDKIKPQLNKGQMMGLLTFFLSSLVGIMLYVTGTQSNARNNETRIDNIEELNRLEVRQYNQIIETLSGIKEDVAYIKGKEDMK
jgi:hypothetical protein